MTDFATRVRAVLDAVVSRSVIDHGEDIRTLAAYREPPDMLAILMRRRGWSRTRVLLEDTLVAKNRAYGDSALNPVRVFSRASASEQLRVRLDDKIARLERGRDAGEDTMLDLMGYLVLLIIAETPAE